MTGIRCARTEFGQSTAAPQNRVMNSRRSHSITSSARASSVGGTVEAESLGSLEVDRQLVLGRHLHRKVGWFLSLEDAIDVVGGLPVHVNCISPVGHQAATADEGSKWVYRR